MRRTLLLTFCGAALIALIALWNHDRFSKSRDITRLLSLADQSYKSRHYAESLQYCELILKIDPGNIAAMRHEQMINTARPRLFNGDIITRHEQNLSNGTWALTYPQIQHQ